MMPQPVPDRLLQLIERLDGAGHADTVSFAGYSPDGHRVLTASWDYTARVWDAASGLLQAVLAGHSRPLRYAGFSTDGRWIVTLSDDQTARIWDAATGQELARFWSSAEGLLAATFLQESDRIVVLTRSGKLVVVTCELCTKPDVLLRLASERVSRQPTPDEVRRYHLEADQ
jgi:WD40 repeat protein